MQTIILYTPEKSFTESCVWSTIACSMFLGIIPIQQIPKNIRLISLFFVRFWLIRHIIYLFFLRSPIFCYQSVIRKVSHSTYLERRHTSIGANYLYIAIGVTAISGYVTIKKDSKSRKASKTPLTDLSMSDPNVDPILFSRLSSGIDAI